MTFRHLGKRLAFTPAVPGLWFEVGRNADLKTRARDVLTDYWRTRERDDEDAQPEATSLAGKAWVQTLELSPHPAVLKPKQPKFKFLSLGDDSPTDGGTELHRVGRCLDWLYPDELDRAHLRDAEVRELADLLAAGDRRPVLLVGPRQAGKTTIVHEVVYRRVAAPVAVRQPRLRVAIVAAATHFRHVLRRPVGGAASSPSSSTPARNTTSSTSTTWSACSWPGSRPSPL